MSAPPALRVDALEAAARALERPGDAVAFWVTDLDAFAARAAALHADLAPLRPRLAYALKANGLPALARAAYAAGLDADAGSAGELALARHAGFEPGRTTLSGSGHAPATLADALAGGVARLSVDDPADLPRLEALAARHARAPQPVALRVNPGIVAGGHRHLVTAADDSKFGTSERESLAAWAARAAWPHLQVDGLHLHLGSQIDDPEPLLAAARAALALAARSAEAGAPLRSINLGGGFAIDYAGERDPIDLAAHARAISALPGALAFEWRFEPGRWLVAPVGALVATVLRDKRREDASGRLHRFVVLSAGMNDLLRPALYGARHRIVPLRPRPGAAEPATVVGPVCETGDTFARDMPLPPLEPGDRVAILDAGAYGSVMSSNYNGRPRLAEVILRDGRPFLARAAERVDSLFDRERDEPLGG